MAAATGTGPAGALVASVVSGSPAEHAGIVAGDTITAIDGTSLAQSTPAYARILSEYNQALTQRNALLKSLQRLHVDPMAIYGTNCLKFADGDEEESRPFLLRELHIVQPKLVVAMGEPAVAFLNSVKFPLARELAPTEGELQKLTPTIDAFVTPDIDESLDEQADKTRFWNAFKLLGEWWASLPPY